jgi:hypothetical protein
VYRAAEEAVAQVRQRNNQALVLCTQQKHHQRIKQKSKKETYHRQRRLPKTMKNLLYDTRDYDPVVPTNKSY